VSPQFDQTAELHFPGRRRQPHTSFSSTLQSRTREASHSELRAPGRNARVCRFPSLSFTGRRASTARTDALCARRRPALPAQTEGASSVPWSSPPQQASCTRVVSPPDIDTPQTTPKSERNAQFQYEMEDTRIQDPKGRDGHCGNYDTPVAVGPGVVLAEDTPEQEYGVRITWRRRQQLMRYLKERGRLNSSQILVKR
ncbi:hypothetical protein FKM82_026030, partial [Ascaphus truei]